MKAQPTYIIAEAGVNHNGSVDLALKLIDAAAEAGADAVKFQTFRADDMTCKSAAKADYQLKSTDGGESQFEMLQRLELSEEDHMVLVKHCRKRGIEFLSTPFDLGSVELLLRIPDLPLFKISSGDITNAPLLLKCARTGKPVILSTGMSNLAEIKNALGVLAYGYLQGDCPCSANFSSAYESQEGRDILQKKVTLLHCTTEYPAPYEEVNLRSMETLRSYFDLPVGFSDHTPDISVAIAAAALGAVVIEKHFTTDKSLPGPDHKASLTPERLKDMVQSIRRVELAIGRPGKFSTRSEEKNKPVARKSLVAARDIQKGELFDQENITVKRPGNGVSPMYYWDWLGKPAQRDYKKDELL